MRAAQKRKAWRGRAGEGPGRTGRPKSRALEGWSGRAAPGRGRRRDTVRAHATLPGPAVATGQCSPLSLPSSAENVYRRNRFPSSTLGAHLRTPFPYPGYLFSDARAPDLTSSKNYCNSSKQVREGRSSLVIANRAAFLKLHSG